MELSVRKAESWVVSQCGPRAGSLSEHCPGSRAKPYPKDRQRDSETRVSWSIPEGPSAMAGWHDRRCFWKCRAY